MKKKKLVWIVLGVIVLVGIGVGVAAILWRTNGRADDNKASDITAVYLSTGDIYFGKMDWLPWPRLKNVWFIQRGMDQKQQPQLGLAPLKGVFWTPIDEVYLNPKEIVFWTKVKDGSQLATALENPDAFRQSQEQLAQPTATSGANGFKGPANQPPVQQ